MNEDNKTAANSIVGMVNYESEIDKIHPPVLGGSVNFRPLFFLVISLISGIVLSAITSSIAIILIVIPIVIIVTIIVCLIKKKKFVSLLLLFFIVGYLGYFISFTITEVDDGIIEDAYVTGRICYVIEETIEVEKDTEDSDAETQTQTNYTYYLENVSIDARETDRKVKIETQARYDIGDIIAVNGDVECFNYDPFDSYTMSYYNDDVNYILTPSVIHYLSTDELTLSEKIKTSLVDGYKNNMTEESAGISYALMFGDKTYLTKDIILSMKTAGVMHIFAVSGLHIGFLVGALYWFFAKIGMRKQWAFAVCVVTMFLYGALVGFPASMVRAIIMTTLCLLANLLRLRYDSLSTLSLAGIIILVLSPLSLFELGFQMSFAAMLGIICFYSMLRKVFASKKSKTLDKILQSLAISVSAMSFLILIQINVFGVVGIYFALTNLLVIPLVSMVFVITALVSILFLIIPQTGILFAIVDYLNIALSAIVGGVSELPSSSIEIKSMGILSALVFSIVLFVMSKYVMLSGKKKVAFLSVGSTVGLLFAILVGV